MGAHATLPAVLATGFLVLGMVSAAPPAATLPAELRDATLIDSLVARVDRHPITSSQLELEARLALARHGDLTKAEGPLAGPQLQSSLDYLIDQILLDDEAERLGVFEVTEEEGRAEIQQLARNFPSPETYQEFCARFGLTADFIEGSLRRALRAERYLNDKLRVQAQGGATTDQLQAAARTLVGQLRSRADVRMIVHYPELAALDAGAPVAPPAVGRF